MNIFDLFKSIESAPAAEKKKPTWLVVGLGNVGTAYERTRHNAGFMAADRVGATFGIRIDRAKFHSMVGEGVIAGEGVLLMKPETLMNLSGVAVGEAAAFYKIPPEHILVLHDEISFSPGKLRIRRKGSAGGHNGLKSIIEHIGSENFPRVKIGVGQKPSPDYDLADWVLSKFSPSDLTTLEPVLSAMPDIVSLIIGGHTDDAMAKYSG